MNRKPRANGLKQYLEDCAIQGRIPPQIDIITATRCSPSSISKPRRRLKDRYVLEKEQKRDGPECYYGGAYIVTKIHKPEPISRSNGNHNQPTLPEGPIVPEPIAPEPIAPEPVILAESIDALISKKLSTIIEQNAMMIELVNNLNLPAVYEQNLRMIRLLKYLQYLQPMAADMKGCFEVWSK